MEEDLNMERIWKHFGKNTRVGKMLYDIYGVNYKPEDHINYPKINKKKTGVATTVTAPKTTRSQTTGKVLGKINYPEQRKVVENIIPKIDLIKRRKNQTQIDREMKTFKLDFKPLPNNPKLSRKQQIEGFS